MKNRKVLIYGAAILITMLILVISFAFAFLGANQNLVNNLPVNITFANGVAANFTVTGHGNMSLNIPGTKMLMDNAGEVVAQNIISSVYVRLQSSANITCTYDITWNWLDGSDTYERSFSAENEFVVSGTDGTQMLGEINVPYSIEGSMVLGRYVISANNYTASQSWTFTSKFYNLNVNQDIHADKTYQGQISIENAHCYEASRPTLANYIINNAPSSGTDSENNKWYFFSTTHSSDSKTDYRYAGANPDNWIEFNGEMWRIIGVMPVDYDTNFDGKPDTQGNLVKIIRNTSFSANSAIDYKQAGVGSSVSSSGSNAWSDSQTMLMLNPSPFYTASYTVEGTVPILSAVREDYSVDANGIRFFRNPGSLWNTGTYSAYRPAATSLADGYTSTSIFTKCSNTTTTNCLKPIDMDSQSMVATVKWNLGGISSVEASAETIYGNEKSNSVCATITSAASCTAGIDSKIRPTYWYGKVGLPYASDFGYAGGGSSNGTTYPRTSCPTANLNASGNYRTYCGLLNYLLYRNATDSTKGAAVSVPTMTNFSTSTYLFTYWATGGYALSGGVGGLYYIRPTLYLDPRAVYISGDGSYDNPYRFL